MRIVSIVIGIVLLVMSLMLAIIYPVVGIIGIVFSVWFIWYSRKKYKKKEENGIPKNQTEIEQPNLSIEKRETIKVAGISQYTDAVLSLGSENPDYSLSKKELIESGLEDQDIPQYLFRTLPATFEFEPDNPYDSNAIAVYVTGVHIGYVKQGSTAHIRKLIQEDKIESASCEIVGGKHKRLDSEDGTLEKIDLNYGARIILKVKE